MNPNHRTYIEAGYNRDCWGGASQNVSIQDASELNTKACTLWDATFEAHRLGPDDYPKLKACYNLNKYGRSLKNMFDCPNNDQPSPVTKQRVLNFLEGFSNQYNIDMHTCKQLVDEALGRWRYLI